MGGVKNTQGTHPAGQPPTKLVGHPVSMPAGNGPDKSNAPPRGQQPGADARKQSEVHSPQAKTERLGNLERQRQHVLERLEKAGDRHAPAGEKKQGESGRAEQKSHGQQTGGPENGKAKSQQGDTPRAEGQQAREAAKDVKQQAREAAQGVRQEARDAARDARDAVRQNSQGPGGQGGRGVGNGDAEKSVERGRDNFSAGHGRGHQEGSGRPGNGVGRDQGQSNHQGENGRGLRLHGESASSLAHLRNEARGLLKDLPRDVQQTLDSVSRGLGRDVFAGLGRGRVEQLEKFVAQLLKHAGQGGETREHPSGRNPWEGRGPESAHRQTLRQAADAAQLLKHFAHLEKKGGESVRRAEAAALRFISDGLRQTARTSAGQNPAARPNFDRAGELLRDLRGGAFLPPPEPGGLSYASARARVVVEMAELLHTLEAIERAAAGGAGTGDDPELMGFRLSGGGFAALGLGDVPEELLGLLPMLPGRAARVQMLRFMAALTEPLVDSHGRVLLSKEGLPLKPGELLWLGPAGGLLSGRLDWEGSRAHLSSLLVNGFDALYTLIGFDGRTLASPHYAAVQVQVNASDLEWVFGQPPLTEGWARAHIERMKDAAVPDLNLLGETLEEALLDGRFHTVLLRGSVAEGEAVEDSFSLVRLPSEGPSFSWA